MAEFVGQEGSDENLIEDWELVKRLLPEQWEQKARELGSFRKGAAAQKARARVMRESQRNGTQLQARIAALDAERCHQGFKPHRPSAWPSRHASEFDRQSDCMIC